MQCDIKPNVVSPSVRIQSVQIVNEKRSKEVNINEDVNEMHVYEDGGYGLLRQVGPVDRMNSAEARPTSCSGPYKDGKREVGGRENGGNGGDGGKEEKPSGEREDPRQV